MDYHIDRMLRNDDLSEIEKRDKIIKRALLAVTVSGLTREGYKNALESAANILRGNE